MGTRGRWVSSTFARSAPGRRVIAQTRSFTAISPTLVATPTMLTAAAGASQAPGPEQNNNEGETMSLSRREVVQGAASAPMLAFLGALPAGAADFEPAKLIGSREAWAEVERINREMGPTRLTGSSEHQAFVAWIGRELDRALAPAGGQVFRETFENYPRWSARSWSLTCGGQPIPVASYFPYCTGGFTGTRTPLTPAAGLAAPGGGGHYPKAGAGQARIIAPGSHAEGQHADLGVF